MANRSGLILTAALVGLLSAPVWAAASDEPVATAPIPPPLPAKPPAASPPPVPDKPAFVNPMAPKPAQPPKAAAAAPSPALIPALPKRPVRSAAKKEPDKKTAAERHRTSRQARKEARKEKEKEPQHTVAHIAPAPPPVRRPPPRPRYYAGDFPPPPPWYDGVPFAGYHPGPWRRPMMPW